MMSIVFREEQVKLAQSIVVDDGSRGTTRDDLARGLLAEHGEVIAARAKIADMTREAQASAEFAVETAQRFADDLAAARGVTAQLRASFHAGCLDVTQAEAIEAALDISSGGVRTTPQVRGIAAAFLARVEAHKATVARLEAALTGVERVIAEARSS